MTTATAGARARGPEAQDQIGPYYIGYRTIWDAVEVLRQVLPEPKPDSIEWGRIAAQALEADATIAAGYESLVSDGRRRTLDGQLLDARSKLIALHSIGCVAASEGHPWRSDEWMVWSTAVEILRTLEQQVKDPWSPTEWWRADGGG